ncbi:MAG: hypothetical protein CXT77_02845 [uncultured DHVE6 group euryarchaeote]|jgi:hypothetical protein|nr:MAG: hypothetical protein CXT77_02845 [uncultured DHVE6 group euryarchaeote]
MIGKKGYMYFIEIIFAVLLVSLLYTGMQQTSNNNFDNSAVAYNENFAFDILRSLDEFEIINEYESENWGLIEDFVSGFVDDYREFDLDYCSTSNICHPINDGALGTAGGNNITNLKSNFGNQDLASAQLTYRSSDGNWSSIRLYIWDKL